MADFDERPLQALDARFRSKRISSAGRERILSHLRRAADADRGRPTRRLILGAAVACGLACIFSGMAWLRMTNAPAPVTASLPEPWSLDPSCDVDMAAAERPRLRSGCQMAVENEPTHTQLRIRVWETAELSERTHGLSVHSGAVTFDVEPVLQPGAPPIEVGVPFGLIEVLGTRFAVDAMGSGGHVVLYEGKIRFTHTSGQVRMLEPGERLSWTPAEIVAQPDVARRGNEDAPVDVDVHDTTTSVPKPSAKRRLKRSDPDAQTDTMLEEVSALRRSGKLREALELLESLERRHRGRTREVLSFERGLLLEQVDPDTACDHWHRHSERFGTGRYSDAVQRRIAECSTLRPE